MLEFLETSIPWLTGMGATQDSLPSELPDKDKILYQIVIKEIEQIVLKDAIINGRIPSDEATKYIVASVQGGG